MSIKRTIVIAAFILGAGSLILAAPASAASRKLLAMGATQSSSSHYAYFVAIAKIMNTKVPDLNVSVVETGASVDNINRINKGDLDLGMTTIHLQYQANKGLGTWKGKPVKDQYVLWVYQPAPQNFVIREDSGVKTVADLQESLDYLRLSIKYLVFDLEATRRENGYLRKMLEETRGGGNEV